MKKAARAPRRADVREARPRLRRVLRALEARFGVPRHGKRTSVLAFLINGILSQNTNDRNRDAARERLWERFPSFEALARARTDRIAAAVRPAGLGRQRAETIKRVLSWAKQTFGGYSLESVRKMETDEALSLLSSVKGVGVKTAALVLLFECRRDINPVDTHIARVAKRLGFAPERAAPEKVFRVLQPIIPKGKHLSAHLNLIRLGREICWARVTRCSECPLFNLCSWKHKVVSK